jgi:uncharacterized membrane protein YvbJ
MKKKIVFAIIVIIVIFVIITFLLPNEKNLLMRDITSLKNAVEKEDKKSVLVYLDEHYIDRHNVTYEQLITTMDEFFSHVDSIQIFMSGMKVWIDSTDSENCVYASCSLGLRVLVNLEGEKAFAFGSMLKPSPVRAWFIKVDTHYRIYCAEY